MPRLRKAKAKQGKGMFNCMRWSIAKRKTKDMECGEQEGHEDATVLVSASKKGKFR